MANINVKDGTLNIEPDRPAVGNIVNVTFRLNNTELLGGPCSFEGPTGLTIEGHPVDPILRVTDPSGDTTEQIGARVCAPLQSDQTVIGVEDPLVEFEFTPQSSGTYVITAVSDPVDGLEDARQAQLEVIEADQTQPPDNGDGGSGGGGGDGSDGGNGGGGNGGGGKSLFQIMSENPVGSGLVIIGGSIAIREAISGDDE